MNWLLLLNQNAYDTCKKNISNKTYSLLIKCMLKRLVLNELLLAYSKEITLQWVSNTFQKPEFWNYNPLLRKFAEFS